MNAVPLSKFHGGWDNLIRPHPLMFSHFREKGAMTAEEIVTLKQKVHDMPNIAFDDDGDYLKAFRKCDFLIADKTSLLLEFFATGKPIIFCDEYRDDELTSYAKEMIPTFYSVKNSEELISEIGYLAKGMDETKERRMTVIRDIFKSDGNVGKRIVDTLIRDLSL